jgi:hypothetical protein
MTLTPEGVLVDRGPVSRLAGEGDVEESDGEGENPVDEDEELGVFEEADVSGRIFVLPGHDLLLQDAPGEVRNLDQKLQNLSPLSLTLCQIKLECFVAGNVFRVSLIFPWLDGVFPSGTQLKRHSQISGKPDKKNFLGQTL